MSDTRPTCAGCGVLITKGVGNRVSIVGTEAFHQRCVKAGLVARSEKRRLEQALRDAQDAIVRSRKLTAEAIDLTQHEQRALANVRSELDLVRRVNTDNLTRLRAANEANDVLRGERDAARREAALHQTIQQQARPAPAPPAPVATPEPEVEPEMSEEERDDTRKRYAMMELD